MSEKIEIRLDMKFCGALSRAFPDFRGIANCERSPTRFVPDADWLAEKGMNSVQFQNLLEQAKQFEHVPPDRSGQTENWPVISV